MANERIIPSDAPKTVATFNILSAGTAVPRTYNVLSIIVNKEVNRIASATIIFADGDPAKESFAISNKPDFEPGKEIEIKAGYRANEETIFKGIVVRHAIKVRKNGSLLIVECKDKAAKMTNVCKSKYFHDATDSDMMEELIGKYGIDKEVESTRITHKQVVQYNATDWDFTLCRADVNGMLCITDDGKLKIAKPDFASAEVLTLQYGATIHDLDAEIDARFQFKVMKASAWNFTDQELTEGVEAEDPKIPEAGNLSKDDLAGVIDEEAYTLFHGGKIEEPELQQWVNAKMMKHQLAKIRGKVRTDGTAKVVPGKTIKLNGAGERFEGKLFVTGVRQEVEKGNWHTVIQFGVDPEWFAQTYAVEQPNAGAMLPGIKGLHMGIVTKLEGDPDGEDRICVKIPVINKDDDGTWCRVASLDAGKERGMFFLPEIDDEVVIGFVDNDPRHAIVLGMVNSRAKPAPLPAADDNHEKGYVSRSKMKMIFNDDKKTIAIETPAGNKVLISEDEKKIYFEDQNGNKITMNEDGIKLESIKDIVMKATGDMKFDGKNTEIKSSAQAKFEGGAGAELKSGGTTKVNGSMVQIN